MEINKTVAEYQLETSKQIQRICLDLNTLLNILEREFNFICEKLPWSEQQIRITIEEADDLVDFLISGNEKGNRTHNINLLSILVCLREKGFTGDQADNALAEIRDFNKKYFSLYHQIYEKIAHSMVIIQDQDIVRQNIENLIKCLGMITTKQQDLSGGTVEDFFSSLNFAEKVAEISVALTKNIEKHLCQLCGDLVQIFGEINEITVEFRTKVERNQALPPGQSREFKWLKDIFNIINEFVNKNANIAREDECELIKISEEVKHIYKLLTVTLNNMEGKLSKIFSDIEETWFRMKENTNFEQATVGICQDIYNLKENIVAVKSNEYIKSSGVDFTTDKEELKEVLSQFTCLIERKTAQAIWGEETAEEGDTPDIVLF